MRKQIKSTGDAYNRPVSDLESDLSDFLGTADRSLVRRFGKTAGTVSEVGSTKSAARLCRCIIGKIIFRAANSDAHANSFRHRHRNIDIVSFAFGSPAASSATFAFPSASPSPGK